VNVQSSKDDWKDYQVPVFVYIVCCPMDWNWIKSDHKLEIDQVIQNVLVEKEKVKLLLKQYPILIQFDNYFCKIQKIDEEDTRVFIATIFRKRKVVRNKAILHDLNTLPPCLHQILNLLPKTSFVLTIGIGYLHSLQSYASEIEDYFHRYNSAVIGAGLVKNHIIATISTEKYTKVEHHSPRTWIVFTQENNMRKTADQLNILINKIAQYVPLAAELDKMFEERSVVFRQIESSEKSTLERIRDVLGNVRRSPDQVTSTDLASMLTEVSGIFSRLTTITGSMRRDYIVARRRLRDIREIFSLWGEKPILNYTSNIAIELTRCENVVNTFSDSVDRLEALRSQLNTVLDAIKTYVGIKQQNISLEEQRSMKTLLARMVNLQEVLHKFEILIVAFYITEMGRLVFEMIAREIANVLTVSFIPIALILAVGIRRLLHKRENASNTHPITIKVHILAFSLLLFSRAKGLLCHSYARFTMPMEPRLGIINPIILEI